MGVKQDFGELLVSQYAPTVVNRTVINKTEYAITAQLVTGEMFVISNVPISVMEMYVIMKMVDVHKDAIQGGMVTDVITLAVLVVRQVDVKKQMDIALLVVQGIGQETNVTVSVQSNINRQNLMQTR